MLVAVLGLLPYGPRAGDPNALITAASYKAYPPIVTAPACWAHWRHDSYTCSRPATVIRAADGLAIMHTLDTARPEEARIAELVKAGRCYFSPGVHSTPGAVQKYLALHSLLWGPLANTAEPKADGARVLTRNLDHVSYCESPALEQPPAQVIYEVRDV